MSINAPIFDARRSVRFFTVVWICATTVASIYFSFWLFPDVYDKRTTAVVGVKFQTTVLRDGSSQHTVYYPNQAAYRTRHGSVLSDADFLYFSACEALPLSQRPICDSERNWKRLDPQKVECSDVISCSAETYRISEDDRYVLLAGVKPVGGTNFSISDMQSPSLSDPGGWGKAAQLPIFFICMFLGLRLGRSAGEFIFTPYEK